METKICDLPNDLLVKILMLVQTEDAVATAILSKRWRSVWTMLPELQYLDKEDESICYFIEESLQLHKAPILKRLSVILGPCCPADVNVETWIENAVNRSVASLEFMLFWTLEPIRFPKCLYTCDTLVDLTLSNQILVDVSSEARLPSLKNLDLVQVMYKEEDSFVRLLSSSPVLECLWINRHQYDNLKNITVKVPSLTALFYFSSWINDKVEEEGDHRPIWSVVIDSPSLTKLTIYDGFGDYFLIENTPCLDKANIGFVPNTDDMFLRSIYNLRKMILYLTETMVKCYSDLKFSWLLELYFEARKSVDWMEPLMVLLTNSPKLTILKIRVERRDLPPTWKKPSSIPECLSSHLENFEWIDYEGTEDEKQLVAYIFANSKCLKKADISILATTSNLEEKQKELESLPRVSTSSQLLFYTQLEWMFYLCGDLTLF